MTRVKFVLVYSLFSGYHFHIESKIILDPYIGKMTILSYIRIMFSIYRNGYDASIISKLSANSLENKYEGIKFHRLNGLQLSYKEATTQYTNNGIISHKRIIIGVCENNLLYIIDGRHLLEAYRVLGKSIPQTIIHFLPYAKNIYLHHYKNI